MSLLQVVLLAVLCALCCASPADMTSFCREQEEVYESRARAVRRKLISMGRDSGDDLEDLCNTMVGYSNTAFDTHTTCPQNDESTSNTQWQGINGLINNVCPEESLLLECSHDVVQRLMSHCAQTVNNVQPDSPRSEVCKQSLEYLKCLETAASLCSGSRALIQTNLYAAVASTRSTMMGQCPTGSGDEDRMQGDAPGGGSGPVGPATPEGCTVNVINTEMAACVHSYRFASRSHNADLCRVRYNYLNCVDRVRSNCPFPETESSHNIRNVYQVQCRNSYFTCLPEILDGSTDVANYCLNRIGNIDVNSAAYCEKLRDLNRCLSSLRDVCPVVNDSLRETADRISAGVDLGLGRFCGGS